MDSVEVSSVESDLGESESVDDVSFSTVGSVAREELDRSVEDVSEVSEVSSVSVLLVSSPEPVSDVSVMYISVDSEYSVLSPEPSSVMNVSKNQ